MIIIPAAVQCIWKNALDCFAKDIWFTGDIKSFDYNGIAVYYDLYTNIYYKGIRHMGLCDLSVASPILSVLLSGGFQNVDAYTQLEQLNADCIKWLNTFK